MDSHLCEQFDTLIKYIHHGKESVVRDTEKSCNHVDETVIDGSYVCTQCAHVIEQHVYAPEHDFHKRCMPEKRCYQSRQRLLGVDRHLVSFLKKTNIGEFLSSHFYLHPLQETLHSLKKSCLYKSLNYAIALSCLLFECDYIVQMRLRTFLPRSNVSWLRFARMLRPLPSRFPLLFCLHLLESSRQLTPQQVLTTRKNLPRLSGVDTSILLSVVDAYCWEMQPLSDLINNFDSHHEDLQCILYDYVKVVQACDRQSPRQRGVTRRRRVAAHLDESERVAARLVESERFLEQYV